MIAHFKQPTTTVTCWDALCLHKTTLELMVKAVEYFLADYFADVTTCWTLVL